jgi:peptidoglycan/xylan/chitin deacetylase (PgdA/CDA1 family)
MSPERKSKDRGKRTDSETGGSPEKKFPYWPFEEIRVPYRERAARVKWPNNGPLCVYTYVTAEWRSPQRATDSQAKFKRELREESNSGQYEMAVGIWRAINLLDRFDLKVSIFAHTGMVDRYPDLFRELHGKGHEIIARTYNGHPTTTLPPREERAEIRRCTSIVEKVVGARPRGFNNPGGKCTDQTPHILGEEGYLWMGGLKGDDLPYGIKTRCGKKIIVVGSRHSHTNDNAIFYSRGARSAKEAFEYFKDLFDAYYDLGKREFPGAMNYGIHPYLSCVPERFSFQERALDYMLKFKDVWFVRCVDLAEYWADHYLED